MDTNSSNIRNNSNVINANRGPEASIGHVALQPRGNKSKLTSRSSQTLSASIVPTSRQASS